MGVAGWRVAALNYKAFPLTPEQIEAYEREFERMLRQANAIPEGSMRVAPGSDALVWRIAPEYSGEL